MTDETTADSPATAETTDATAPEPVDAAEVAEQPAPEAEAEPVQEPSPFNTGPGGVIA